jgi:hypothetical protein
MDLLNERSVLDNLNESILYFEGATPLLCFDESTEILCLDGNLKEVYVPIFQLKVGDFVKSFKHGFRRISTIYKNSLINNIHNFQSCMFLMPKNETMTKDLIVTGGHSILVDDMTDNELIKNSAYFNNTNPKIDDKHLLLAAASEKFTALENDNEYTFYNFCLENEGDDESRYGVWANGVLVETPCAQFLKDIFCK